MAELPDGYVISIHPQLKEHGEGVEVDLSTIKDLVFCKNCEHAEWTDIGNNCHEYVCTYWDEEGTGFAVPDDGFCHAGTKRQKSAKSAGYGSRTRKGANNDALYQN